MTRVGTGVAVARSVSTRVSVSRKPSNLTATLRRVRSLTSPTTAKFGLSMRRHSAAQGTAMATNAASNPVVIIVRNGLMRSRLVSSMAFKCLCTQDIAGAQGNTTTSSFKV